MPTRLWLVVCLTTLLVTPSVSAQEHPGATSYNQVCQFCHGAEGRGDMAPGLVPLGYDADYVLAIVREGYGQMPPISTRELNDNQIRQVVSYLESLSRPVTPTTSYEGPRTADGHPDLNGIWQVLSTAAWNIQAHNAQSDMPAGLSVVEGNEIPYQSWAASQQRENYANRATEDPVGKCYLPGVPRVTYMPFPFQILQTPDHVVMTYEFAHAVRIIYTDGSPHPLPNDFWMGDSRGLWTAIRWSSTRPISTIGRGSTRPEIFTATHCTWLNATLRPASITSTTRSRSKTPTSSLGRGPCVCRCIDVSRRDFSCSTTIVLISRCRP